MEQDQFDVGVIGAGHAGLEAAAACARMGLTTVMFTTDYDNIGQMSCNPAVGGLAKGQIALEVDALGGWQGRMTEDAGIQFKTLNRSKGPAVQAPRAQCDRELYRRTAKRRSENADNLTVKQERVDEVLTDDSSATGLRTQLGNTYHLDAVVVCTGTFLHGQIHLGTDNFGGGRSGEAATTALAESLNRFGFERGRLKTGTPPRLDGSTVNYDELEVEPGEDPPPRFSFFRDEAPENQKPCWITETNVTTHETIRDNLDRSPIYGTGVIDGTGVRYCPSIEDKVVQFEDKDSHRIVLEPEGLHTNELYTNGLSTSLPPDTQLEMVRSVPGLEDARVTRWGYAIEYDFFQPTQLRRTLETREVDDLFFAGQINGTTGYEEAAGQGIVAGINAAANVQDRDPFVLERTDAYIGVLVDDLVTQGTDEPYRMFTSRAEHRLCLRKDNAHYRLTPKARKYDLISDADWERFRREREARDDFRQVLADTTVTPGSEEQSRLEESSGESLDLDEGYRLRDLLKRPEIDVDHVLEADLVDEPDPARVAFQVGVEIKYEGYIKRQEDKIDKAKRMESRTIPDDFPYKEMEELSNESIEKLTEVQPETLGQASRISGVKPSDIQVLMVHLESDDVSEPTAQPA